MNYQRALHTEIANVRDAYEQAHGCLVDPSSLSYIDSWLRNPIHDKKLPIPDLRTWYREPGLWLPLSCTIAFVNSLGEGNHGTDGWTTSGSLNTSTANFIVVGVGMSVGVTPTVSDNKSNTYTPLTKYSGSAVAVQGFYAYNPSVGSGHTWTISGTGLLASMAIMTFSGVKTSADPFDKESGTSYFGSSPAEPGAFTPTNDNSLVVSFLSHNNGSPAFSCSGFTIADQVGLTGGSNYGTCSAYVVQGTKTSVNASWTDTTLWQGGITQVNFEVQGGASIAVPAGSLALTGKIPNLFIMTPAALLIKNRDYA